MIRSPRIRSRDTLFVALCAAGLFAGPAAAQVTADLVIRGGTIYTGNDAPFIGDIAIAGDKIVAVSRSGKLRGKRTINAKGMIVTPGFIDPHTHVEDRITADDARERLVLPFLMQGVTTAFIGNDGGGTPDVGALLARAKTNPVGINYAAYVGFGAVRSRVIGAADRAPTAAEMAQMQTLVSNAMCQGAMGLSTGLFYAPQSFANTDEVVTLAKIAGARGGIYDSHIRDESSYSIGLAGAISEAISIGERAGLPTHISHIKALGVDVQGKAHEIIALVTAAQARGHKVTADQYPWSASGTSLVAALIPRWAQDGGREALLKRFDDPTLTQRLNADIVESLRKRGGAAQLLITEGRYRGQRLDAIAQTLGLDPVGAAIAVIREHDPAVASFNQSEDDIKAYMAEPWVMTGSDSSTGHPRTFGSFARKYAQYVKREKAISLRDFIERSSALPAKTFGLAGRGTLTPGNFADVVVFDPKTYAERATYDAPDQLAAGVQTVIVNGAVAVDKGVPTGIAAGIAIVKTPPKGCP